VLVGYGTTLVLLLAPPRTVWATLLFPVWVFLLSVNMLVVSLRRDQRTHPGASAEPG
jgi:hypothetical protein